MLPLWRDRVLVSLEPSTISWVRLGRSRSRVLAKGTRQADPGFGTEQWQGAVAALRLEAETWRTDAVAVTIVLSNHFARYVLVPPSPGLRGDEEAQALARFHFARVHGERSRGWEVRLSNAHPTAPQIGSAIDRALLESLSACFPATASPRLISVQPYLMAGFNRWRAQFPGDGAWFLLVEPERACIVLVAGGRWSSVQNVRGAYDRPDSWIDLLERERLRATVDRMPEAVLVHAPQVTSTPLPGTNWKGLVTGTFWPAGLMLPMDAQYGAALTAS